MVVLGGRPCLFSDTPLRPAPDMKGFAAMTMFAGTVCAESVVFKDAMFHDIKFGSSTSPFVPRDIYTLNGGYDGAKGGAIKVHNENGTFPDTQLTASQHYKMYLTSSEWFPNYSISMSINGTTTDAAGRAVFLPGSAGGPDRCLRIEWGTFDASGSMRTGDLWTAGKNPPPPSPGPPGPSPPPQSNCEEFYNASACPAKTCSWCSTKVPFTIPRQKYHKAPQDPPLDSRSQLPCPTPPPCTTHACVHP